MAVPLIIRGTTIGALNIYATEPEAFDAEEVRLLTELADDLAYGLAALRTRAAREQAEEQLRRNAARAQLMAELSRELAAVTTDYQTTIDTAARRMVEVIGDFCLIHLVSDDGEWLNPIAIQHQNPEALTATRDLLATGPRRADEGVSGRVVQTGQPSLIPVVDQAQVRAATKPEHRPSLDHFPIYSLLTVPLRAQGRVIGAVTVGRHRPEQPYSLDDQTCLQDLADRAALAIANARLLEETQRLNTRLEQRVAERTAQLEMEITERQRAEDEIHRAWRFVDSIVENIPNMIFVKDAQELRFVRFNRAGEALLGLSRDELIGKTDYDFFPTEAADDFTTHDRAVLAGRQLIDLPEEAIQTRHQGVRILHTQKLPILDEDGHPQYLLGISEDITERKQAEAEIRRLNQALAQKLAQLEAANQDLQEAKEEAERANQAKSEFLSRMSHELRTPLNAILGFAQILGMGDLDPRPRAAVEHILNAGRHLLDLINEVLDIARIESGRFTVSLEPVQAREVVQEILDVVQPLTAQRKVALQVERSALCDHHIRADRQRIKQVLLNLLSNAVKYNRAGGTVTVVCEELAGRLRIRVSDTGPGIAADKMARLFVAFDRLDVDESDVEGTGLGLALSKRLIEVMDGAIGVESVVGQGSSFWVELPIVEGPVEKLKRTGTGPLTPPPVREQTRTVLYVEDNPSNMKLVEEILSHRPAIRLLTAMQGRLSLDLARDHRPDLILLDLNLPDLPGAQVLSLLQADPATQAIPVVVLSADATPRQIERLLAAGARTYLTKPFDVKQFLQVLDELLA
jgi:PAS domain S-box-containing protein